MTTKTHSMLWALLGALTVVPAVAIASPDRPDRRDEGAIRSDGVNKDSGRGTMRAFGLVHAPIGGARIDLDPDGNLVVSDIGSTGDDGVSVDLGGSEGIRVEFADLELPLVGSFFETAVTGTVDGEADQLIGTLRAEYDGDGVNILADLTPIGSPSYTVEVWESGILVARETGVIGPLVARVSCAGGNERCVGKILKWVWDHVAVAAGEFVEKLAVWFFEKLYVSITGGRDAVLGDEIRIYPETDPNPIEDLSNVSVRFADIPAVVVNGEALRMFQVPHRCRGEAYFDAVDGHLTLFNLGSTGDDGVSMELDAPTSWEAEWLELDDPPGTVPDGARLTATARGIVNSVADQTIGSVAVEDIGAELEVTADYSPIGATTYTVKVFDGGEWGDVVGQVTNSTGPLARFPRWPLDVHVVKHYCPYRGAKICLTWKGDRIAIEIVGGPTVEGDYLSIEPDASTSLVGLLSGAELATKNIPAVTIMNEVESHAAPIPVVSQWGLVLMILTLMSAGTILLRRHGRRARAVGAT